MSQVRKNHSNGFSFEHRFVEKRLKQGAKRAIRHHGSKGVTDVEWTDAMGFKNEAQLKFSTVKLPKISAKEMQKIILYAFEKKKEGIKVWTVCKMSRGAEIWECIE